MERSAIKYLKEWKEKKRRKPLIIEGARQVGKTWLVKEFASQCYQSIAYVNFEDQKHLRNLFSEDYDIHRILLTVETETKVKCVPGETLIFFDEIQEADGGLTALKYFNENAPEQHVIAAGSLLGIELHKKESFPVGKVDFLKLHPLNFKEYLLAVGENGLFDLLQQKEWSVITTFYKKYEDRLRQYYYIGGMPEAVSAFADGASFDEVREIQNGILDCYDNDFSKHAPNEIIPRIRQLWNSIPAQLSKENRKFVYGLVKEGARAREYEMALMWLKDCGLVHSVHCVRTPKYPLKSYEDISAFKLFIVDIGLLGAMNSVDAKVLLKRNDVFSEYKGALTEQYVMQQLIVDHVLYYWSKPNSQAEIDFLIQNEEGIVPIEVKAEENLKAKSLKVFYETYKPKKAIRTSMSVFRKEEWMTNIPLYAI